MSNNYFEGYYFKHQKDGNTVAFIPGKANDTAFIQVIDNDSSYNFEFPDISMRNKINVGNCTFSTEGVHIDLPGIKGEVEYTNIISLRYDIMGPFKYFPMECRHGIISMRHKLKGEINIDGKIVDFTNGIGYIEKDSGRSFPKEYIWLQCNDFPEKCSIMCSVAHIPFAALHFKGCICVIVYRGKEYRFATYLNVKILQANKNGIILRQGKYKLEIDIADSDVPFRRSYSHPLNAPINGRMTGIIHESNRTVAKFRFFIGKEKVFDLKSENAGFECAVVR